MLSALLAPWLGVPSGFIPDASPGLVSSIIFGMSRVLNANAIQAPVRGLRKSERAAAAEEAVGPVQRGPARVAVATMERSCRDAALKSMMACSARLIQVLT